MHIAQLVNVRAESAAAADFANRLNNRLSPVQVLATGLSLGRKYFHVRRILC